MSSVHTNVIDAYLQRLSVPISFERLNSYRIPEGTSLDTLCTYYWNMALCEALYPTLNAAEIALRNSIHAGLTAQYGTESWFDNPALLDRRQAWRVAEVRSALMERGKPGNPGRIVAQLSFGFWVTMLSAPYEERIWRRDGYALLRAVFPRTTRRERLRRLLYRRFADINVLRNRVFHHEPVWTGVRVITTRKHHNLGTLHQDTLEAIGWISLDLRDTVRLIDRFPEVYAHDRAGIEQKILNHLAIR